MMKKAILILLILPIISFSQGFGFIETKTSYYENGNVLSEINYKDGKRDGLCRYYWKNGQILSEVNYKAGKTNGLYKSYYEDGQLNEEGNYKYTDEGVYSRKEGIWKTYYENGQLKAESTIKDGISVDWKTYGKDGIITLMKEGDC